MADFAGRESGNYTKYPSTAYAKGDFYCKGKWSGLCRDACEANEPLAVATEGVFEVPKTAATLVIAEGDELYSVDNSGSVNKTSASRVFVGRAYADSGNGTANVQIDLDKGGA